MIHGPIPPTPHREPGGSVLAWSTDSTVPAVEGDSMAPGSTGPIGVVQAGSGIGVVGSSGSNVGVLGTSSTGIGVQGTSSGNDANSYGVWGKGATAGYFESTGGFAVQAVSTHDNDTINATGSSAGHAAVSGTNTGGGFGVWGKGKTAGHFESDGSAGAVAINAVNTADADAVVSTSSSPNHAALAAHNNSGGFGVWAASDDKSGPFGGIGVYGRGATHAAVFDGAVQVNGTLTATVDIVLGSDCAEDFAVASPEGVEPGTVMVLTEDGALEPSQSAYDKKVAGVISGAGEYQPGLILGRQDSSDDRMPLALVGKVYCKVDAQYGPVEVGDLLTTSPTPGHAMRAADPLKAFGAVIGKALRGLETGEGLIPVLVALQ